MSDTTHYLVWVDGRPLHAGQPLTPQEAAAHFVDQAELADQGTPVEVRPYSDSDLADEHHPFEKHPLDSGADRYVIWVDGHPLHPEQPMSAQEIAGHFVAHAERADHSTIVELRPWHDSGDDPPAVVALYSEGDESAGTAL